MADKEVQNLDHAAAVDRSADRIPMYDASASSELKYATPEEIAPTIDDASTTVKGKVELATDAEIITGTDTARAVTPSNITAKMDTDGTLAGNLDTRIPSQKAVKTYADAKVADAINNGTTTVAPSQNAVFDALALKPNAGDDAWTPVSVTWTYGSATTINVPTGAASLYQIGDKIKITQTTEKFFYVIAVADTLLTVTGGSDYTVANATITSPYYSHAENPVGFPSNFNWAPARTVSGGTVPTYTEKDISYFRINGGILIGAISWVNLSGGTAGAGGNNLTFNLPVAAKSADFSADRSHIGIGNSFESAGTIAPVGVVGNVSASVGEFITSTGGAAIKGDDQSSTNRYINASLCYRIA